MVDGNAQNDGAWINATRATQYPNRDNFQPSTIDHRPSPIAHRPSPIAHRPSPIAHRPSTIDYRLPTFTIARRSGGGQWQKRVGVAAAASVWWDQE